MLSWGRIRRALQPLVLRYWIDQRSRRLVKTRVEGFQLDVFPGVFHPRYFGSSAILARFVSLLPLKGKSLLDMGCGSGLIAMCASRSGAQVTATDINPEAVRCTAANAERNRLSIDVRVSDLFSSLGGSQFDIIACNPPFLPGIPESPAENAFYGGPDFDMIRTFAAEARDHLRPGGSIYVILSADIDIDRIEQIFREQRYTVSKVATTRWLLRETMVILCIR
jgi:release factor glutamine methyltransferase